MKENKKIGAVMVVGAGIGRMQSDLVPIQVTDHVSEIEILQTM